MVGVHDVVVRDAPRLRVTLPDVDRAGRRAVVVATPIGPEIGVAVLWIARHEALECGARADPAGELNVVLPVVLVRRHDRLDQLLVVRHDDVSCDHKLGGVDRGQGPVLGEPGLRQDVPRHDRWLVQRVHLERAVIKAFTLARQCLDCDPGRRYAKAVGQEHVVDVVIGLLVLGMVDHEGGDVGKRRVRDSLPDRLTTLVQRVGVQLAEDHPGLPQLAILRGVGQVQPAGL